MKTIAILAVVLTVFIYGNCFGEFNPKDSAAWWIKQYDPVTAANDPLVGRAEKVFHRVAASADKNSEKFPRLVVIKGNGDPYAAAIRDGSIILTQGAIKLCYKGVSPEKGDSRLAFILGHELAHQAKNHFWHQTAFESVRAFSGEGKNKDALMRYIKDTADVSDDHKAHEVAKVKELQADADGIMYAAMAGYDPKTVVAADGTDFFEEWVSQITGKTAYDDPVHPNAKERADFLRSQLAPIVEQLDYFHFGVRLYQLGRYEEALVFLDRFREKFPSREVFNNLGLAHYQIAMEKLGGCDPNLPLRFKLSTILDSETLAAGLLTKGGTRGSTRSETSSCYRHEEFRLHINEAVKYLELAVSKDPSYLPARVNLSSALIMSGDYAKAISVADEALKIRDGYSPALNNRGVALFLFGSASNIDMAETAIDVLRSAGAKDPGCGDSLYNIAAVLKDRKREAAAKDAWLGFLKVEDKGPFAAAARREAGISTKSAGKPVKVKPAVISPVRLGYISGDVKKSLLGMEKKDIPTGTIEASVYRGRGTTALILGDSVELVETEIVDPIDFAEFRKANGGPQREIASPGGTTHLFRNFAADVVEGKVVMVVFFEGGTL